MSRWPTCLFMSWVVWRDDIFNALSRCLLHALDVCLLPPLGVLDNKTFSKKRQTFQPRPLMCIIFQSFNKTRSKFSAMFEVFFLFPVKISHVGFQLAVSLPPTGAVCEIVCMSPSTSHCEEEKITAAKEWNWEAKKFVLSLGSRTKEQKKLSWCYYAGNIFQASDINELRVLKLSFELCLSSPHGF